MGDFLASENNGIIEAISGTIPHKNHPTFAIFDGMGGEQQGEVAAYISATTFDAFYKESSKNDIKHFLSAACTNMNDAICSHVQEQRIRSSGSTAAIITFGKKDIYICNIGDSRIYQYSDKILTQISHDHSATGFTDRKPPLTQNLGIPKTEFVISPYISKGIYKNHDTYLICSDGLSDMVTDEEIGETLGSDTDIKKSAEKLMQKALNAGGQDNITIILCKIQKQNIFNRYRRV